MGLNVTAARERIAAARAKLLADEADLDAQIEAEANAERNAALDKLKSRIESERGRHVPALEGAVRNVQAAVAALLATGEAHNADVAAWAKDLHKLDVPQHVTGASTPSPAHARMGSLGSAVIVNDVHARPANTAELLTLAVAAGQEEAEGREVTDPLRPIAKLVETVKADPEDRFFIVDATGEPMRLGPAAAEDQNMRRNMSREISAEEFDLLKWGLARVQTRTGTEVVPAGSAA